MADVAQPFPELQVVQLEPPVWRVVKLATYYWFLKFVSSRDGPRPIFAGRDVDGTYEPHKMVIRIGFETDGASIPSPIWPLLHPFELGAAFMPHDVFYGAPDGGGMHYRESRLWRIETDQGAERTVGRWEVDRTPWQRRWVDDLFNFMMAQDPRVKPWKRQLAYRAVRWFGGEAFRVAWAERA